MKKILILTMILFLPFTEVSAEPVELNDAQIIEIVITANQADLSLGHLVKSKSTDNEVNFFAQRMFTDHSINLESIAILVDKLNITPQNSPICQDFIVNGMKNITNLNSLDQIEFNKTYINQEVIFHEQVLEAMDSILIPNAKNAELKQLLKKIRPAFNSHLKHAKRIQEYLNQ